jgi:hypothetical protein
MKKLLALFLVFIVSACSDEMPSLPDGYELISADGNSYFVYIDPDKIGNKSLQREVGRTICEDIVKTPEYCEVYFWNNKEEIPKKFPIINRKSIIGLYQMKGDKVKLKALTGGDSQGLVDDFSKRNNNQK